MLDWLNELFNAFAKILVTVLPTSPFAPYIESFSSLPYLAWLNWFIPIKACLKIGAAWLAVIVLFYGYSIVMRWGKMIGD